MNGSVLDTNIITKLLDQDLAAISLVQKIDNLFTSIVVVGELYFAAANSSKREANFNKIQEALSCMEIIQITDAVCMSYAEIKLELKRKGKPIPDNDIWIAACACVHGFSIATFDHHFSEISRLELLA
ncbi:MAG: PIN domain-containing protein [Treponema sp.]|jgi:tRNA(fMet)-specific endonuclease VapC|nr:PIN domain-containing protein [Treponema sp.]